MSFFRNIRSSITRRKSSSRDTTPVRSSLSPVSLVGPSSAVSHHRSEERRDSLDSRSDSVVLNRGETFILNSDQEDQDRINSSNSSTLEKKSKKSKVLSKFNTFTKRKKTTKPPTQSVVDYRSGNDEKNVTSSFEHHPSDNATNTYYNWNTDGCGSNVDYDAQTDPFNFLYEQRSNLKLLQNGGDSTQQSSFGSNSGNTGQPHKNHGFFDSSTYRKGKANSQLKAQLEQLKTQHNTGGGNELHEEDQQDLDAESEKYKTVTLNSFRKSFRDKYLQQQNEAPHNPAWFVEVETPSNDGFNSKSAQESKENRPDYLIFKNENYRPGSRSPVRDRNLNSDNRNSRSKTRSPVKRNETFRVERSDLDASNISTAKPHVNSTSTATTTTVHCNSSTPSIRVEIKNSVIPHSVTGRMVPIGVAKPMPSLHHNSKNNKNNSSNSYLRSTPHSNSLLYNATHSWRASTPPQRKKSYNKVNASATPLHSGKHQTLVQISNNNESNLMTAKQQLTPPPVAFNRNYNRSNSTRIQLGYGGCGGGGGGDGGGVLDTLSTVNKFKNNVDSRYSFAALPSSPISPQSYKLLRQPSSTKTSLTTQQQQFPKQTYFGDNITTTQNSRIVMSPAATVKTSASPNLGNNYNYDYSNNNAAANANTNINSKQRQQYSHSPTRRTSSKATVTVAPIYGYVNRRDLHQPRFTPVPPVVQRRSRSPIKMPWR